MNSEHKKKNISKKSSEKVLEPKPKIHKEGLQTHNTLITTGLSNHSNNMNPGINIHKQTPIKQYGPNIGDYNSMYNISNVNMMQNNSGFGLRSLDYNSDEIGENIKVCIRIRPLNTLELGRGDSKCVEFSNLQTLHFHSKNISKNYSFNCVFHENTTQEELFTTCAINKLIDSALEGYSVTVFAYGQTGSGKSYTIMGREDSINQDLLIKDQFVGVIPRSIKYLWNIMGSKHEKFFVKVSFLEIYNEQIRDLLNPNSSSLQVRWNAKQGFFVEDLLVVDCTKPEDVAEVLLEGHKNRKIGSHELNKDSSRSHSILTVYIISEFESEGHFFKKYGKISFVDLAGSERLKESKSQGEMIKETGNINKSLFTLGKVISSLTDKKTNKQHIPYRDSKLTMLLMDSIGGASKTLMIACVSPSGAYADETLSTLNYASRAMNIKNKPFVQMDAKEQIILSMKRENEYLKAENQFLKNEFIRLTGSFPSFDGSNNNHNSFLPLINNKINPESTKMNHEFESEINRLKDENIQMRRAKEVSERQFNNIMSENQILQSKLQNLENVFVGSNIIRHNDGSISHEIEGNYSMAGLTLENNQLKKQLDKFQLENAELKDILSKRDNPAKQLLKEESELKELKENNSNLQRRVEFLQKRERELLETIMKLKNEGKK